MGLIANAGTINNEGTIIDSCGGQVVNQQSFSYTGNPPEEQSCNEKTKKSNTTPGVPEFPSGGGWLLLIALTLPVLLLLARVKRRAITKPTANVQTDSQQSRTVLHWLLLKRSFRLSRTVAQQWEHFCSV